MNKAEAINILKPEGTTAAELKAAYRKMSMQFHPDKGGDPEIMKVINLAYEFLSKHGFSMSDQMSEGDILGDLMEKWNMIKGFSGVQGEICGNWIWVDFDTWREKKLYKSELRSAGFKYSNNKDRYFWHPAGYRKRSKRRFEMDDIRNLFGSSGLESSTINAIA